jgi:hypothetical protein
LAAVAIGANPATPASSTAAVIRTLATPPVWNVVLQGSFWLRSLYRPR